MSDLIRKNDALDILCKFCGITEDVEKCRKTSADGWCKEYCELKNMPTVDAVPVIRCKDCAFSEKETDMDRKCGMLNRWFPKTFYCALAVRKEK